MPCLAWRKCSARWLGIALSFLLPPSACMPPVVSSVGLWRGCRNQRYHGDYGHLSAHSHPKLGHLLYFIFALHFGLAEVACDFCLMNSFSFSVYQTHTLLWMPIKLFPAFPAKNSIILLKTSLWLGYQMSIHLQILEVVFLNMPLKVTQSPSKWLVLLCPPEKADLIYFNLQDLSRVMQNVIIWHPRGVLIPFICYRTLITSPLFHGLLNHQIRLWHPSFKLCAFHFHLWLHLRKA